MITKRKAILSAILLILLVALFIYIGAFSRQSAAPTYKQISLVVSAGEVSNSYIIKTNAIYLRQAIENTIKLEGVEGNYGLYLTSVDGIAADESKQEWWCITKNGEDLFTGVDSTLIADGEQYELTLKAGY